MSFFAVIATGGKQYEVREGMELRVEKLEGDIGSSLNFPVLLLAAEDASTVKVGTPEVSGASVSAQIVAHDRADKVHVIKYKPKVRYRRNVGHRQPFTKIKIEKITG